MLRRTTTSVNERIMSTIYWERKYGLDRQKARIHVRISKIFVFGLPLISVGSDGPTREQFVLFLFSAAVTKKGPSLHSSLNASPKGSPPQPA